MKKTNGEHQSLCRLFRSIPKTQVLIVGTNDIEQRIATHMLAQLRQPDLPVMVMGGVDKNKVAGNMKLS